MKLFLNRICIVPFVLAGVLLSGCCSIYETEAPPMPEEKLSGSIKIEGLGFRMLVASGQTIGSGISLGNIYSWVSGKFRTGTDVGIYGNQHYAYKDSDIITEQCRNYLEEQGVNVRGGNPSVVVRGKVGEGSIDWSKAYVDIPIDLFLGLTGIMWSSRHKNWCELRIYRPDGTFLKKYHSEKSYNSMTLSFFPFAYIGDEKLFAPHAAIQPAILALQENIRLFIADYKRGLFR